MLAAGIKTPVPLEELEIHLRDEIERQIKLGSNGKKAFEISAQRIGQPKILKSEFEKARKTTKRKQMKVFKIIIGSVAMLWAFMATLTIPKCIFHLNDPSNRHFVKAFLIAAVSSLVAGIVLSLISFRSAFPKKA